MRRASASSTPFTNRALCSLPYRSARRMASWITTRGGVSPRCSSAAPRRSTQRSMTPSRSSRQFVVTAASSRSISSPCVDDLAHEQAGETALVGRDGQVVPDRRGHAVQIGRRREGPTRTAPAAPAPGARVSTLVRHVQPIEEVDHLQRGERRVPTLVAVRAAGARLGLLHRVAREQPESNRRLEFCRTPGPVRAMPRPRRSRSAASRRESPRPPRRCAS